MRLSSLRLAALVLAMAGVTAVVAHDSDTENSGRPSSDGADEARAFDADVSPSISVMDHGAVGDGSDDTKAFIAAITAAAAASTALEVPSGTYTISASLDLPADLRKVLLAPDAVISQTIDGPVFVRRGSVVHGPFDLTGAFEGARTLTLQGDEATVQEGEWLVVASTRLIHRSKGFRLGSLRRIVSVDGRTVAIDRPLRRDLTDATTGWSVDLVPPIEIRGGVIEHARPEDASRPLILLEWVDAPRIEAVEVRQCGGSGVKTVGTVGGSMSVYVHDCLDDHSGARFDSGPHYGYGVEVTGPTRDLSLTGRAHSVRHAFTTNGSYPMEDERLVNVGEPENIDVSMDVWDTTSSGLDTHEVGVDIRFHDCSVRDAGRYAREGSTDPNEGGFGLYIRASRTVVERCEISRAAVTGLVVASPPSDADPWPLAEAPRIRRTKITDTRGQLAVELKQPAVIEEATVSGAHRYGISFDTAARGSVVDRSTIELSNSDRTIAFVNADGVTLRDNVIRADEERAG